MRVVKIETGKLPTVEYVKNDLHALQREVGGYIEVIRPFNDDTALIVNEEGGLLGMPPNRCLLREDRTVREILRGDIVAVGVDGENFRDLTPQEIGKLLIHFSLAQTMVF